MVNWHDLATTSPYQTAVAIKHTLSAGDVEHARIGIEELVEALARAARRTLESYLIRLMQHIIKWHVQPEHHSPSWAATIRTARRQIARLQRDTPSLNRRIPPMTLTWDEVFETEYSVEKG
jgi:methionyl-tRNA formyltransferase